MLIIIMIAVIFTMNQSESEGMIKSIGFSKLEDGRWFVDLTDFFVEPCQHGHGLKKE